MVMFYQKKKDLMANILYLKTEVKSLSVWWYWIRSGVARNMVDSLECS